MKYLKKFESSEWDRYVQSVLPKNPSIIKIEAELEEKAQETLKTLTSVREDIDDILLEASDEGFDVNLSINRWSKTEPFFDLKSQHQDGYVHEPRYSIVIHIVKRGLKKGQSMFANSNYFDINTIKEPLIRLEGYVKDNLPDYKMKYTDGVNLQFGKESRITLVTISIDNY